MKNEASPLHTPRLKARQAALEKVFSESKFELVWKKYVRPGLRNQEFLDLFDYNDFHWSRQQRIADLKESIIGGTYKPKTSIPLKSEKKIGVCRTIVLPLPEDALVLQCIVERILLDALKKQPSKNSFFSRSHQSPNAEFAFERDYIWFKRWREFSKTRIAIPSVHRFVGTTDIANFFDNVSYRNLRNILSSEIEIEEVVLDFLFNILEQISWRPDYLPSSNLGLPQLQFDAPRLLAHVYLYEIDEYLKTQVKDVFVRWVDDITFAVSSASKAKKVLKDLDVLLQMRGLRLNSGKTKILSSSEAYRFFHRDQNMYLDKIEDLRKSNQLSGQQIGGVKRAFVAFLKRPEFGHSGKIIKRYLGLFASLQDDFAINYCLKNYVSMADQRDVIYRYLLSIGPSLDRIKLVESYIDSDDCLDDSSCAQLANLVTGWEIVPETALFRRMKKFGEKLGSEFSENSSPFKFIFVLNIMAKYCEQKELVQFLEKTETAWATNEFLSRQVAASLSKIRSKNYTNIIARIIRKHSFRSALSVLAEVENLKNLSWPLNKAVRLYVLNGQNKGRYKISRFLIAFAVLQSPNINSVQRNSLVDDLLKYVSDPHYKVVLRSFKD